MRFALPVALLLGAAAPTAAQTVAEACRRLQTITVGQWAQYDITASAMGRDPMRMRIAIVGTERADGAEHFWHEMLMDAPQGQMIMQALVPGYPYAPDAIKGMIVKGPGQPAMRIPQRMVNMMRGQMGGADFGGEALAECASAELIGTVSVTTAAGTFNAMHMRSTQGEGVEIWVSLDVPFGIVQMRGNGGTMDLTGFGTDARSSITETPRTMPGG